MSKEQVKKLEELVKAWRERARMDDEQSKRGFAVSAYRTAAKVARQCAEELQDIMEIK